MKRNNLKDLNDTIKMGNKSTNGYGNRKKTEKA